MDDKKLFSMNDVSKWDRETRACYHVTLGEAIRILANVPGHFSVEFDYVQGAPMKPHSYRGYYSDLALDADPEHMKLNANGVLKMLSNALGKTFTGWKGGDFKMDKDTPLWLAAEGSTGRAILGMEVFINTQCVLIKTKEVD